MHCRLCQYALQALHDRLDPVSCVCVCVWGGGVTINELMSFCVLIFHDWTRASYEQRPHFHTFLMILIPALMSVTKQLQALHKGRQPEEKRIR